MLLQEDQLSVLQPRSLYPSLLGPFCQQKKEFGVCQVHPVRSSEEANVCPRRESKHDTSVLQPLLAALTADMLHVAEFLHATLNTTL